MRASHAVIAGAAFVGALACVVLLVLSSTLGPSRSRPSRVVKPTNVRGFGINPSAGLIAEGVFDLRSGVQFQRFYLGDDYPRGPVQPGERPRTLPALRLDPAWPLDREALEELQKSRDEK